MTCLAHQPTRIQDHSKQAEHFAWAVRDTLDQYLTIAKEHGFTKRGQLLDLLDNYPDRDVLTAWIRETAATSGTNTSTASQLVLTLPIKLRAETRNRIEPTPRDLR